MAALIVGCSKDVRAAVARMLAPYGFDCIAVRDVEAAAKFAAADTIDLFVIDVDAKELGGQKLLELIRLGQFGPNPPPTILYSAQAGGSATQIATNDADDSGPLVIGSPPVVASALAQVFPESS